jgi:hypothetical protein
MLPSLARLPLLDDGADDEAGVVWPADRERVDPSWWRRPPPRIIQESDICIPLKVKASAIAPGQPGLFAVGDIPARLLVCVYTWDDILSEEALNRMPSDAQKELRRYAVESPDHGKTLVIYTPVNPARHPAAIANEPKEGSTANMEMKAGDVEIEDEGCLHVFRILALYTCAPVNAGEELTWNYGPSYAPVREQENYVAGRGCSANGRLLPPPEERARLIYRNRGGNVAGVLARVNVESSESTQSSDGYVEEIQEQDRRVQPRRGVRDNTTFGPHYTAYPKFRHPVEPCSDLRRTLHSRCN